MFLSRTETTFVIVRMHICSLVQTIDYPLREKHYAGADYNYAFVMIEQMGARWTMDWGQYIEES